MDGVHDNMRFAVPVLIFAAVSGAADTEIHRCLLDDGTMAFQETPCPEPVAPDDESSESGEGRNETETRAPREDVSDSVNPFDEPDSPLPDSEQTLPEPVSQDRAACEKQTRDAIDAIDLEMRENAYTKEESQEYLSELLTLTQQLRACKQL